MPSMPVPLFIPSLARRCHRLVQRLTGGCWCRKTHNCYRCVLSSDKNWSASKNCVVQLKLRWRGTEMLLNAGKQSRALTVTTCSAGTPTPTPLMAAAEPTRRPRASRCQSINKPPSQFSPCRVIMRLIEVLVCRGHDQHIRRKRRSPN